MKSWNSSLQYFVVQKARLSNKEAIEAVLAGRVLVNGQKGRLQQVLRPEDGVTLNGQVLKAPQAFTYLAYYKPRGVESTLNPEIDHNLVHALNLEERLFPIGRLDKESEGLLLLTNDGHLYKSISQPQYHQEKEYLVTVDQPLTPEALARMASGVVIMEQMTRPARVQQVGEMTFTIILTQGLNRQIRRMCYQLGYTVNRLVRTRMVTVELGNLPQGAWRSLTAPEVAELTARVSGLFSGK
ncbi:MULTISPECIES: pseudouridine synthase [Rufibacter]|uniref:Pseudouridine synthase n=1 Tax=Rufibacter quisquiliarum TaxID=1549639 RepID=A0A839GYL7_9BACT|nr:MULTISPECIES: pseudouridine synthase [Rufibacter]MBA9078761.1 23S rRNA pseudouridine2604 synthase [Rufibacter quisquiliarum]